jgi:hypothetical protein
MSRRLVALEAETAIDLLLKSDDWTDAERLVLADFRELLHVDGYVQHEAFLSACFSERKKPEAAYGSFAARLESIGAEDTEHEFCLELDGEGRIFLCGSGDLRGYDRLSGVVSSGHREEDYIPVSAMAALRLFISYSHADTQRSLWLKTQISEQLAQLGTEATIWTDLDIPTGIGWKEEIIRNIEEADYSLLFVTPEALTSDFIVAVEAESPTGN